MRSWSKCVIFSRSQKSSISVGPRPPPTRRLSSVLSIGVPNAVVMASPCWAQGGEVASARPPPMASAGELRGAVLRAVFFAGVALAAFLAGAALVASDGGAGLLRVALAAVFLAGDAFLAAVFFAAVFFAAVFFAVFFAAVFLAGVRGAISCPSGHRGPCRPRPRRAPPPGCPTRRRGRGGAGASARSTRRGAAAPPSPPVRRR